MKITSAKFTTSAFGLEECPDSKLPEFAFVGRSNVGKSSLINMLTGQNELAHTSGKPGKTQRINFFKINEEWSLIDLPGYGYARVSREQQQKFNINVSAYLTERENLKQVFLLVDSQLEPLGGDLSFAEWLEGCGVPYSIILTKTDRGSDGKLKNHADQFMETLSEWGLKPTKLFKCSAKTGRGRGTILQWIETQLPRATKQKGPKINLGWMK